MPFRRIFSLLILASAMLAHGVVAAWCLPAYSSPKLGGKLESPLAGSEQSDMDIKFGSNPWVLKKIEIFHPAELLAMEMIRDENLISWQMMSKVGTTVIPVANITMYLNYRRKLENRPKGLGMLVFTTPPKVHTIYRVFFPEEFGSDKSQSKLVGDSYMATGEVENLADWIFYDAGIFSGKPWSWTNFFPRIFAIAFMIIIFLVVIEILHILVVAVLKTLRRGYG